MDFLSAETKKVAIVERWPLVKVQLKFIMMCEWISCMILKAFCHFLARTAEPPWFPLAEDISLSLFQFTFSLLTSNNCKNNSCKVTLWRSNLVNTSWSLTRGSKPVRNRELFILIELQWCTVSFGLCLK